MKWLFLILFVIALCFVVVCPFSCGEELKWGMSLARGIEQAGTQDHELQALAILPRYSQAQHESWESELEGILSCYYARPCARHIYLLGLTQNVLLKPVHWRSGFTYLLAGAGVGYNSNGCAGDRVRNLGNTHMTGILQVGPGVQFFLKNGQTLRVEYRIQHVSDPFRSDSGINSHLLVIGLSFGLRELRPLVK